MKKLISLSLIIIITCSLLVGCNFNDILQLISTTNNSKEELDFEPGEVLVLLDEEISEVNKVHSKEFFAGVEIENIVDLTYRHDTDVVDDEEGFRQTLLIVLAEKTKEAVLDAVEIIKSIPGVLSAGPNYYLPLDSTVPNDPIFSFSHNSDDQWGLEKIEVDKVWDYSTGTPAVRIGIIDTGISNHDDLDNNYVAALDFYSSNTDDPIINTTDEYSHGTHVAGIIGAEGNNGEGISGVNWDVSLVQMRVGVDMFHLDAVINALDWATEKWDTDERISIISYSSSGSEPYLYLEDAIRRYCAKGGLFICATGNDPQDNDLDGQHHYPSFYGSNLYSDPIANMITVGRTDINDNRPAGANWGMNTIDIYAPGENIISTVPTDLCSDNIFECTLLGHKEYGYHYKSGSSMSTPHVSGVAALLLSMNPNLTAIQIKNCILNGADIINITTGDGNTQSVKRLNAWGAFKYMLENYIPLYTLGTTNVQGTLFTDRTSTYYLEKHPLAKIVLPYSEEFTFTISGVGSSVDVVLYDSEMNEIEIEKSWTNSLWTVSFTEELMSGIYYISPSYNATTGGSQLNLTVSHTHSYDFWKKYSASKHIECCACGLTGITTSFHVVKAGDVIGNEGNCKYCGALLNLDDTIVQVPGMLNVQKVTINGSYILPNGIIVLVDEDIEAYENGTLVWYDKDKVPVTQ